MSPAALALLLYLGRYLRAHPNKKAQLLKIHVEMTGRPLARTALWRHTRPAPQHQPLLETSLVYLVFLSRNGQLTPSPVRGKLFNYRTPDFLK